MKGERLPRAEYSTSDRLRIGTSIVNVAAHDDHLGVWIARGSDSALVEEIARSADERLAAGEWEEFFTP